MDPRAATRRKVRTMAAPLVIQIVPKIVMLYVFDAEAGKLFE